MVQLDRWVVDRALQLQQEIIEAYKTYQFHQIFQKIHNFCGPEMGGLYLDVIKDRQYTTQADSIARRSCQTAIYHVMEAMVRWLAPILSFTAEELWRHIPGERAETIFVETWYEGLFPMQQESGFDRAYWDRIISLRSTISKSLEQLRSEGAIGSSLDAEVDLYCDDSLRHELEKMRDELRFVLITSAARVHPIADKPEQAEACDVEGAFVVVQASPHEKCGRCWHHREDVGQNAEHPELCGRCVENVVGDGEQRQFA